MARLVDRATVLAAAAAVGAALAMTPVNAHAGLYNITTQDLGSKGGSILEELFAATITTAPGGTDNQFSLSWSGTQGTGQNTDVVGATATITVTSFTLTDLVLSITIKNTSNTTDDPNDRLVDFGVDVDPNGLSGVTVSGGSVFTGAEMKQVPNFNDIDACAFASNNCSAGSTGLAPNASDTFSMDINYASGTYGTSLTNLSVTLEDFGIKFTAVNGQSIEIPGTPGTPCDNCGGNQTTVPEPSSVLVMAMGLLGLGYVMRRRRLS